jgi:hypothetical protein
VSIVWEGFMTVPASAEYVFSVHANDGVSLRVNQQTVLQNTTIVESELSGHRLVSEPVQLEQDTFYPIRLEYFESTEDAFVTLLWRLAA